MKKITPGFLDQIVRIFIYDDLADDAGGVEPMEVLYWETSARVIQLKASRSLEANQELLKPVFRCEVRYRTDKVLIEDMIVKWRGGTFRINQVETDYVNKEYTIFTFIGTELPFRR